MIPFRTQYEKLIKAYLNNEVKPKKPCACFIGNLLNGDKTWYTFKIWPSEQICTLEYAVQSLKEISEDTYTPKEILQLEGLFMRVWRRYGENEESLFKAFEAALVLLRQIHESKGEVIHDYTFRKRVLVNAQP